MDFDQALDQLDYIREKEFEERAFQIWVHSPGGESFGEYLAAQKAAMEPPKSREEIYAQTDALFAGRG